MLSLISAGTNSADSRHFQLRERDDGGAEKWMDAGRWPILPSPVAQAYPIPLLTVMGMTPFWNSSSAIESGSMMVLGTSMRTGAPMEIWSALAPSILALSKRVYFINRL